MANHYVIISRMKELEKYSDVENFEYQDENRTKIVKKAVEYVINKGRNNCS